MGKPGKCGSMGATRATYVSSKPQASHKQATINRPLKYQIPTLPTWLKFNAIFAVTNSSSGVLTLDVMSNQQLNLHNKNDNNDTIMITKTITRR